MTLGEVFIKNNLGMKDFRYNDSLNIKIGNIVAGYMKSPYDVIGEYWDYEFVKFIKGVDGKIECVVVRDKYK